VTEKCLQDVDVDPAPPPWRRESRTGERAATAHPSRHRRGRASPRTGTVPQNAGPQFTEVPHVAHVPHPAKTAAHQALLKIQGG
jgi:hypothetical protein